MLLLVAASPASASAPLEPSEVRERRVLREDRPLWREALALPYDALLVLTWPLKQALLWGERAQLDDRIEDVVMWPFRRGRSD